MPVLVRAHPETGLSDPERDGLRSALVRSQLNLALVIVPALLAVACADGAGVDSADVDVSDTSDSSVHDSGADDTGAATEPDGGDAHGDDADPDDDTLEPEPALVELRPLSTRDLRIVDDLGRDVLLRGVNITSLGEYWQGDPDHPPTLPTTEADWDAMAALGVSNVRLIVHWSRIEPERGVIDESYLDELDAMVRAAAQHGIYTVIDMHQDAYSAFIFTDEDEICPEGTTPGKGWDGAPEWAVFTDGLSTCISGDRNTAPAVNAAWNHFYDNREGIRDRFVAAWAAVAERFAGRPEVAGYDILNEPEVPRPAAELEPLYDRLLFDAVEAIHAAEADASFKHLVFIEPAIPAAHPDLGPVLPDPGRIGLDTAYVVSAPHNYAETIPIPGVTVTFEQMNDLFLSVAAGWGVPTWIGEYGFWDTHEETLEKLSRYAADEDANRMGGTWWQWRQPCGDPHSVGGPAEHTVVHLNTLDCPGDVDLGPTEPFTRVLGRGYPRATPGVLDAFTSEPTSGALHIEATADTPGGQLLVWTPTSEATHTLELDGLGALQSEDVGDGRLLRATVEVVGTYELRVVPID